MEIFLISILKLVKEFGYIVIPIDDMDTDIKKGLGINRYKTGEVVICSRTVIDKAEVVASKLGVVLDTNQLLTEDYGNLVLFVTVPYQRKVAKSFADFIGLSKFAETSISTEN